MSRQKGFFARNPFLLAHHPSCEHFSNHTLKFRGYRLCMGCFVIYPTALIALIILYLISSIINIDYIFLFAMAVLLFSINLIRKLVLNDHLSKGVQIVFRAIIGISLALVLASAWLSPEKYRLILILAIISVAVVYNLYNGKKYLNTCKQCFQYSDFPKCEGLKDQTQ